MSKTTAGGGRCLIPEKETHRIMFQILLFLFKLVPVTQTGSEGLDSKIAEKLVSSFGDVTFTILIASHLID